MLSSEQLHRAVKSAFTQSLNAARMLQDSSRLPLEARQAFDEVKAALDNLIAKHEEYTMYLNDEEYPEGEHWMESMDVSMVSCVEVPNCQHRKEKSSS